VGETLLQTSYVSGQHMPLRPRAALRAVRALLDGSDDGLSATASLLRTLGDPDRLRIVTELLDSPRRVAELSSSTGKPPFEVLHELDGLRSAGVLTVTGDEADAAVYSIRTDLRSALVQLLAAMQPVLPESPASGPVVSQQPANS
jgi:DNA-binding transcriptional ArsR family regulator